MCILPSPICASFLSARAARPDAAADSNLLELLSVLPRLEPGLETAGPFVAARPEAVADAELVALLSLLPRLEPVLETV